MNYRTARPAMAAIVIGLLVSCSSGGDASSSDEQPPLADEVDVGAGIETEVAYPLAAYDLDDESLRIDQQARHLVIRECMVAQGFDGGLYDTFVAETGDDSAEADTTDEQARLVRGILGITDEREASQSGYVAAMQTRNDAEAQLREMEAQGDTLTAQYGADFMAALGDPSATSGCLAEAQTRLETDDDPPSVDVGVLIEEATDRSLRDTRVVEVTTAWSECMAAKGHDYETFVQPIEEHEAAAAAALDGAMTSPEADQAQIATALDDIACKDEADVVGTWFAVWVAYQDEVIEANAEALQDLQEFQEGRIRHAEQVLAEG